MEPAREPPWAEHEKVYLLAEILKAHPIPSHVLFGVIRDYNVQPRWNDMPLPPGRSLRSSQVAFDSLAAANSSSDYRRPLLPIAGAQPIMYSGPDSSRKRPLPHDTSTPMGRLIQPRPPQTYPGDYGQAAGPMYSSAMTPTGDPGNKKKRGRPTKAEAQQRAQEAAARGEPYPPPRRARPSITALPEPSPAPTDTRPPEQRTPPTQPTPTQTDTAMTPQNQMQTEPGSESSSGKKRRTKPQPLELEKQRPHGELESPLNFGSGDPSRTHLTYSSFTPISAPLPSSAESRDRDTRMEGVEESQPRTTTPHSFKDTVGI